MYETLPNLLFSDVAPLSTMNLYFLFKGGKKISSFLIKDGPLEGEFIQPFFRNHFSSGI